MTRPQKHGARLVGVLIASFVAMSISVWVVGAQTASGIRDSEAKARNELAVAQTEALRKACPRGVHRDFELYATNLDLLRLTHGEDRAVIEARIMDIGERLPADDGEATIVDFCRGLFPLP